MVNVLRFFKKNFEHISLFVLMSVVFLNSYTYIQKKQGLYLDEVYSFLSTNEQYVSLGEVVDVLMYGDIQQYRKNIEDNAKSSVIEYEAFQKSLYVSGDGAFNYFNVYCVQSGDVHPPFYYFILHTISSITRSSNLNMLGFSINIVCLLLSCFLLFRISRRITSNVWLSIASVAFFSFSYGFLFNVTYFRMYCVLTLEFVGLTLLYLKIVAQNWNYTNNQLRVICLVEFLAMFTQYFSFFFLFPIFLLTIYYLRQNNNIQLTKQYIKAHVITAIIYVLIWPQFVFHIVSGFLQKESSGTPFLHKILGFIYEMIKTFCGGSVVWSVALFVAVLFCICGIKEKGKLIRSIMHNKLLIVTFVPSIVFFIVTILVAPWPSIRYISPALPIVSLLLILVVYYFTHYSFGIIRKLKVPFVLVVVIINSIAWLKKIPIRHLYDNKERVEFVEANKHLNAIIVDDDICDVSIEIPANYPHPYYLRSIESRLTSFLTPLLVDDKYVLYVSRYCDEKNVADILREKKYFCEKIEYNTDFFDVYLVEKVSTVLN